MNPLTWFAIYLMIWWVTFFAILPLWNVSHHEAGVKSEPGNDPGAPLMHNLGKKALINTAVAFGVWLIVFLCMMFLHIPLPTIPQQA